MTWHSTRSSNSSGKQEKREETSKARLATVCRQGLSARLQTKQPLFSLYSGCLAVMQGLAFELQVASREIFPLTNAPLSY